MKAAKINPIAEKWFERLNEAREETRELAKAIVKHLDLEHYKNPHSAPELWAALNNYYIKENQRFSKLFKAIFREK